MARTTFRMANKYSSRNKIKLTYPESRADAYGNRGIGIAMLHVNDFIIIIISFPISNRPIQKVKVVHICSHKLTASNAS